MSTVPTSSCNDDVRTKWLAYFMSRRGRPSREKRVRHRDEVVDQPIFTSKMLIHAMGPKRLNQQAKILPSLFLKPLNKRQELTPVHHVQTRLTPKFWLKCLVCVSCKISAFLLQFPSFCHCMHPKPHICIFYRPTRKTPLHPREIFICMSCIIATTCVFVETMTMTPELRLAAHRQSGVYN